MWLINTKTYKLEDFVNPPLSYSILSHTWEGDEVLFQDMESLPYARSKAGWKKIEMTCEASRQANILHAWIDTYCIDKRSSAELSEAINSMFAWYRQSSVCYVYLSDLVFPCTPVDTVMPDSDEGRQWADAAFSRLQDEMRACRWFTRGWTLQELIAPSQVVFLDQNWNLIRSRAPGSDLRFIKILERLTGIPSSVLEYKEDIATIPVAQRMSWAARRETTRVEDIAYCLLGIFDVNMPLLYGEGPKSFFRLQEEIVKSHDDLSLFAWKQDSASYGIGVLRGCFADSPAEFAHWLNVEIRVNNFESGMEVTSKNVHMQGRVLRQEENPYDIGHGVDYIFDLGVQHPDNKECSLGILLTSSSRNVTYFRFKPYELIKVPSIKDLYDAEDIYHDFEPDDDYWEEREEEERRSISIKKYHQYQPLLRLRNIAAGPYCPARLLDYACNLSTMSSNMLRPNHSADLKGSLHHATLSDCDYDLIEPYTALSYVWDDASQRGVIFLGDSAKDITASLDAALRDMRDKGRVCRIWAHALCIDQSNNAEKGLQVALMGRIYSTAHHTVIHLGKSPPGFEKLFMDLKAQTRTTMHANTSGLEQLSLTADDIDGMRRDLLSKPWFRRVWVFQELVLSTDVWVQCDNLRIRWHHFCEAVDIKSVVS
nr:hypothetical protein FVER53263_01624 [Fusarium verticillioides]